MKNLSLLQLALLSIALLSSSSSVEANTASPYTGNFRVVVDPSVVDKKTARQRNGFLSPSALDDASARRSICAKDRGLQKVLDQLKIKDFYRTTKQKCSETYAVVQDKSKQVLKSCQKVMSNYSKAEIGLYASLACALTFALQGAFFETRTIENHLGIAHVSVQLSF